MSRAALLWTARIHMAASLAAWIAMSLSTGVAAADDPDTFDAATFESGSVAFDTGARAARSVPGEAPRSAKVSSLVLGIGDAISIQVYGRPELATTTYIAADGSITMPLAGKVAVGGVSPAVAGQRVATAFQRGNILLDPQVTIFLVQARSQQVSVLGAVQSPGRFVIDAQTSLLDVLAEAGGMREDSDDTVILLRSDKNGDPGRIAIDLRTLTQNAAITPMLALRGGDSIYVPVAEPFYVSGEVNTPAMYRLKSGMSVLQAISLAGGVTPRGSSSRIEIRRRNKDGSYAVHAGKPGEPVMANDIIRVKERLF